MPIELNIKDESLKDTGSDPKKAQTGNTTAM